MVRSEDAAGVARRSLSQLGDLDEHDPKSMALDATHGQRPVTNPATTSTDGRRPFSATRAAGRSGGGDE
jgi:hypothetical protein